MTAVHDAGVTPALKEMVAREVKRHFAALERDVYLTGPEAAQLAGIKTDTLATYVRRGHGPAFVGRGKLRRFSRAAVLVWIAGGMGRERGSANAA